MAIEILKGKKSEVLPDAALTAFLAAHAHIVVDVGTGDGRYVYQMARQQPSWGCIGLDAARENLTEYAARIQKKPAKGGLTNALYIIGAIESLPPALVGCADAVTVNFPWGSLLRGVALAKPAVLAGLAALAKPGAHITLLVNYNIFDDPVPLEVRDLPAFTLAHIDQLAPHYAAAGLALVRRDVADAAAVRDIATLWARRVLLSHNPHALRVVLRRESDQTVT